MAVIDKLDEDGAANLTSGIEVAKATEWPRWPHSDPYTEELLLEAVRRDRWAVSGTSDGLLPFVARAQREFAKFAGANRAVMVSSGTSAITTAIEALGLPSGSEVLVPGLTWVACASAVTNAGLVPVLVDVDPLTMCMEIGAAQEAWTLETSAVLLVHYMNNHADTKAFRALCDEQGAALIEDCAQAHGAVEDGRPIGTLGDAGVFSFQASKVLTCGEGNTFNLGFVSVEG